ncbi:hypothetical protein H1R13_06315 [Streptomyces mexicanus]|uniref:Uncharacterized protein n=1 Tax=Streptomyces mexicanus TaxID=178566 RepID=A0A7X1HX10_9ACTN|nr:hypothetical protein [Streptomyces mexicanus]MBC2864617.1 hypothetical protein [Streptomyces mexicanus]
MTDDDRGDRDGSGAGGFEDVEDSSDFGDVEDGLLEEELRQAAAALDPVPQALRQLALDAYALYDLDARVAELTFDSLLDSLPVRGAGDVPRMLTFQVGELSVDVEVGGDGLMGQVLPPQPARIEVLSGPGPGASLTADELGRFTGAPPPVGPFALRLHTGGDVVVTEWLRA